MIVVIAHYINIDQLILTNSQDQTNNSTIYLFPQYSQPLDCNFYHYSPKHLSMTVSNSCNTLDDPQIHIYE